MEPVLVFSLDLYFKLDSILVSVSGTLLVYLTLSTNYQFN